MNFFIFNTLVFIALLGACASKPIEEPSNGPIKTLKYRSSVGEIVNDLISNWNSPIWYLRNRGYFRAPQIDFGMFRKQESEPSNNSEKSKRMAVSNESESPNDLSHLFRSLFSTNDNSISDKIRSKLGVAWDMDKLKTSVSNEAHKFFEKFYNKRNEQLPKGQQLEGGDLEIDKQVAQLYPSVLTQPSNDQHTEKEEKKESFEPTLHKETKFLNGIAKLLTNRELMGKVKTFVAPEQAQESKKSLTEEKSTKEI
ncbi:hypothetical protein ACLKA6_006978 [Drosophila palustris]